MKLAIIGLLLIGGGILAFSLHKDFGSREDCKLFAKRLLRSSPDDQFVLMGDPDYIDLLRVSNQFYYPCVEQNKGISACDVQRDKGTFAKIECLAKAFDETCNKGKPNACKRLSSLEISRGRYKPAMAAKDRLLKKHESVLKVHFDLNKSKPPKNKQVQKNPVPSIRSEDVPNYIDDVGQAVRSMIRLRDICKNKIETRCQDIAKDDYKAIKRATSLLVAICRQGEPFSCSMVETIRGWNR